MTAAVARYTLLASIDTMKNSAQYAGNKTRGNTMLSTPLWPAGSHSGVAAIAIIAAISVIGPAKTQRVIVLTLVAIVVPFRTISPAQPDYD